MLDQSHNSWTELDVEMKLASIDFSRWVAEGFRSSWLQTLANQLIDYSPCIKSTILTASIKKYGSTSNLRMGQVQNGCLFVLEICTGAGAACTKMKQRSAKAYMLLLFAILMLNVCVHVHSSTNLCQARENQHENFTSVQLLSSFFFTIKHDSKTVWCMQILKAYICTCRCTKCLLC